ncbi:release factor glutamine methyltransferase [Rhodoferax lithotrophicus]|uniref:Release factor glutamine methyltransferase n=1 Tax=Rhodoferax lithotrophicus TaxID=2798804 RepID=A0ABN6D7Y0_9BURK|nr:class I SAM-dependent methyltransferase [Rhodoferax sp. MIZ03]BCO28142.1 release factor glutamine methyltransferase [Rhodoferax sp. MIZ03]
MPSNTSPSLHTATRPCLPRIHWAVSGQAFSGLWRSERGSAPPKHVVLADDTLTADSAYRLACAGTGILWRGDFQNARQMLQAMARRIDQVPKRKRTKAAQPIPITEAFNLHRQAQAQRARTLGMLLIEMDASYHIALRRAPNVVNACTQAWTNSEASMQDTQDADGSNSVVSLRELLGITSAAEWRRVGVEIAALGSAPHNRIHPHYGVYSPVRGEYIGLVASAHLPKPAKGQADIVAFDIGTGTGVLAAVLLQRGVGHVIATDSEPRSLACALDNMTQLGLTQHITLLQTDLFPSGQASLIVCNPPWLPVRPGSPLERAVYDEGGQMLRGFLAGLTSHLLPGGEGWLILSNLAELLGLRSRTELLHAFEQNGLRVISRIDAKPLHPKAQDSTDALHQARAKEVTSLWRLAAQKPNSSQPCIREATAD